MLVGIDHFARLGLAHPRDYELETRALEYRRTLVPGLRIDHALHADLDALERRLRRARQPLDHHRGASGYPGQKQIAGAGLVARSAVLGHIVDHDVIMTCAPDMAAGDAGRGRGYLRLQ